MAILFLGKVCDDMFHETNHWVDYLCRTQESQWSFGKEIDLGALAARRVIPFTNVFFCVFFLVITSLSFPKSNLPIISNKTYDILYLRMLPNQRRISAFLIVSFSSNHEKVKISQV